jgi:hypothetical protein
MSIVNFPEYKLVAKSIDIGVEITSGGGFNIPSGNEYDFAIDNIVSATIDTSGVKSDNITELTTNSGVTIEGSLLKDGEITCTKLNCTDILGMNVKQSCRVASTSNIPSLSGLLTIDGIVLQENDRVLVKDQTDKKLNGIYDAKSGSWSRSSDADTGVDLQCCRFGVCEGATWADTVFLQITDNVTIGVSDIVFIALAGVGSTYWQRTGTNISPVNSGDTLEVDTIIEDTTNSGVTIEGVLLKDNGITLVNSITEFSTDTTLSGNSDSAVPTERAIKTYVDTSISVENIWDRSGTIISPHNSGDSMKINVIDEETLNSSVTIDGLQMADSTHTSIDSDFLSSTVAGGINENKEFYKNMREPTGFYDTTQLNCTFSNVNRRVTLTPTGANFTLYVQGKKFVKTTETFDISNTDGVHLVYYNSSGSLAESVNPTDSQIYTAFTTNAHVCTVCWDVTNTQEIFFTANSDLHGVQMDGGTQAEIYITKGMSYISGSALENFVADAGGGLQSHARYSIASGEYLNEDIYITRVSVGTTTDSPVYYRTGADPGVWRRGLNGGGHKILNTGTGRLAYNELSGGNWLLSEASEGYYVIYHVFASSDNTYPYLCVAGITEYATFDLARNAIASELSTITFLKFPRHEFTSVGSVLYQTSSAYGNPTRSRVVSVSSTETYLDYTCSKCRPAYGLTHSGFGGLSSDDHLQYALLSGRSGDTLKIDTINEFTSNAGVTIEGVKSKDSGIIFPDANKTDKIVLRDGLLYEIGVSSGHMRFRVPQDGTEEFQYQMAGTQRLNIRLRDTNVCEILNPNGKVKIESVLFDGPSIESITDIESINSITFEDEIKTDKITFRPNYNLGIRTGGNLEFDIPTGEEYEFRINNIDIVKIISTGLATDQIDQLGSSGIIFPHISKINGGLQDTNVTSTIFLGDASNTALSTDFVSTSIIGAINENKEIFQNQSDPSGFVNTTDQTSTFTNGTRLFQIDPTGSDYTYYVKGKKVVISSTKTVTIDATEGLHVIYFDNTGTLQKVANPTSTQIYTAIIEQCIVAYVYWDNTNSQQIYFTGNNEYHGINMSGVSHAYLHLTQGTQFISGCALNTLSVDQDGSNDAHARFGMDSGIIQDEDIRTNLSSILSTTGLRVYYLSGATPVWRRATANNFPIITTGTGRAAYNLDTAGTWSLAEVANNDFVLVHVFAVNDSTYPYIVVLGQNDYATLGQARTGATEEINSLITTGLSFEEFVPIATVIFQTSNGYTNTVKSRIRSTGTGDNYVDWRFSDLSPGATTGDHGNLSGLSDDDHLQYTLLAGRSGDTLKIDTINEFTGSAGVTIEGCLIKDITSISLDTNVVKTNTINEYTGASGVTIENVLLKDGDITSSNSGIISFKARSTDNSARFEIDRFNNTSYGGEIFYLTNQAIQWRTGLTDLGNENYSWRDYISGSIRMSLEQNGTLNLLNGPLKTNTINEYTGASGVTIEGCLIKDITSISLDTDVVKTNTINEYTGASGVTIEGCLIKDITSVAIDTNIVKTNTINEYTTDSGVTIEGLVHEDKVITTTNTMEFKCSTSGTNFSPKFRSTGNANSLIYIVRGSTDPSHTSGIVLQNNNGASNLWTMNAGYTTPDLDFYNYSVGNNGISIMYADNAIYMPAVYNDDISAKTTRDLYIASDGQLGYITSILASKKNITNIDASFIYSLNPKQFNYRLKDEQGKYTENVGSELHYGLIAEDVKDVNSELVFYDKIKDHSVECLEKNKEFENECICQCDSHDTLRGVHYNKLIVCLLQCIKDHKILIDDLTSRVTSLEGS